MNRRVNRQVRLKSRPSGIPQAEHFEIVEAPVPDLSDGQVLVRNIYLSVEPAMRGWVSAVPNYSEPVAIGSVMRSLAVGRVEQARHADFQPGEYVTGMFGWQDYAVVDVKAIQRKVAATVLPISTSLGILGLNGLTAYFGLLDIGQPEPGETVVVSTAAGAVGSCVGQIAKLKGCHTIGIAGGQTRCECVSRSSVTTPLSITRPSDSSRCSMPSATVASTCISITRLGASAMPSWRVSTHVLASSCAGRLPLPAGTRFRRDLASSGIC